MSMLQTEWLTNILIFTSKLNIFWFIPDIYIPDIFLNSQYPNLDFWTRLNYSATLKFQKGLNHFWQPTFSLVHKIFLILWSKLFYFLDLMWFPLILHFHSPAYLKETLGARIRCIIHFHLGIFGTVGAPYYCYIY